VLDGYARVAETGSLTAVGEGDDAGGCCGTAKAHIAPDDLAEQIGYDRAQIQALPEGANMGLSCGNPAAIAALRPGQTVVDLGAGGGFDVFLAGPKVGAQGRVIGVDMTPEMLNKARHNIASYTKTTGLDNVSFRLGEIEHLPLADQSVDVVMSNCVINLAPDKGPVWREIARVLRPGGTVAASDMVLLKPLPEAIYDIPEALGCCVAGAVLIDEYRQCIEDAGLADVQLTTKPEYVQALVASGDPLYHRIQSHLPAGEDVGEYITSVDVHAQQPRRTCGC
jgi:SAM-dependent methyltransferase